MTEITEPAMQMAADLANAEMVRLDLMPTWEAASFDPSKGASAFGVTIARLCARFIAMQEDMAEIAEPIAESPADPADAAHFWRNEALRIKRISARYRVEADPLVEALRTTGRPAGYDSDEGFAADLRTELAKRGLELGAAK